MYRRDVLRLFGLSVVAAACASTPRRRSAPAATATSSTTATGSAAAPTCVLAPEQTEGPFYVDTKLIRRNITEGKPGMPLTLVLTVVDATSCRPIRGAVVDIWQADATGTYSAVQGTPGTALRGLQTASGSGAATFDTIYPGWYPGRTPHVHVKVHAGDAVVHTGQLYFDEGRPTRSTEPRRTTHARGATRRTRPTASTPMVVPRR